MNLRALVARFSESTHLRPSHVSTQCSRCVRLPMHCSVRTSAPVQSTCGMTDKRPMPGSVHAGVSAQVAPHTEGGAEGLAGHG